MAVIHIPEAEAAKDLGSLMKKVALGDEIVIDGASVSARLVPDKPVLRTGAEIRKRLDAMSGPRSVMTPDFADDIRSFRERHPESLDGSKWD